jgi:hypothetical protein
VRRPVRHQLARKRGQRLVVDIESGQLLHEGRALRTSRIA